MIAPELLPRVSGDVPSLPWGVLALTPPPGEGGPFWVQLLPFALILGIFYFVILAPMRKRQKKVAEFQQGLKVGDRVVTTGGTRARLRQEGPRAGHATGDGLCPLAR